jgi:protein TonB
VREPLPVTNAPPPPVTLPIEPTKKEDRVEYEGPPQVVPGPPPPPAPPAPKVRQISRPDWLRKPDNDDMLRFYPQRAQEQEIEGKATIRCVVNANGTVSNCSVVSEEPEGSGFGQATIRASSKFRMRPQMVDGEPMEGATVNITLRWTLGG